jgi:hypothetical protein
LTPPLGIEHLSRTYRTVFPDGATTQSSYSSQDQLSKQLDPDNVTTLYQCNAKGELEYIVLDLDRGSMIAWNGTDRITKTVSKRYLRTVCD